MSDNKNSNLGCIILIVLFIIGIIVQLANTSSEKIAETGLIVICFVVPIVGYFIIRYIVRRNYGELAGKSCLIVSIIGILIILGIKLAMDNFEVSYIAGIIVIILFSVIGAIWLYKHFQ